MNPIMQLIVNAYRGADFNALNRILENPQNVRVVQIWLENHPGQISHSPMLKDLKNRVYPLNNDIESKILTGRLHELTSEELVKNLELIEVHLELKTLDLETVLPILLDKLTTEELTAFLKSLPKEGLSLLRLSALLAKPEYSNIRLDYLPPFAQNFRQILQQPKNLAQDVKNIWRLTGVTEDEKDAALAYYIEHHKISLKDIKYGLSDEELLRLAPHLRYVDLKNFNIPLALKLLQKCSNLNVLLISSGVLLENVSSLPCKELYCSGCNYLPALPLCKVLHCGDCPNLSALPALPLCEDLLCYNCTNLQALPELPLCERLHCAVCTNLRALPELPLCKTLICSQTNLQRLPALPLCQELNCQGCTKLPALPELPLCTDLNCIGCTKLRALPVLPHCKMLACSDCTNLTTLPLSLGQNAGLTYLDISGTKIEPAVRDAILNQCRLMREADAVKIFPSRLAKWKTIAKSDVNLNFKAISHDQIKTLNEWLLRLERTKDFSYSQSILAKTVLNILADLLKNNEFQELFFPQAEANNACCEDRAAMSLNEIYTSWMVMCKSGDLHMLTGVAKTLRLRKELQKLIGDQGESVEIFLYYESALRERLGLETAIQNMTYGTIGKRNWINEDKLVENVEAHFFEELFELPAFQKMIVFDDSEFSDKLENLGECPIGDPNDEKVLNYQHRQGEIMQERRREKMRVAKQWYDRAL